MRGWRRRLARYIRLEGWSSAQAEALPGRGWLEVFGGLHLQTLEAGSPPSWQLCLSKLQGPLLGQPFGLMQRLSKRLRLSVLGLAQAWLAGYLAYRVGCQIPAC